MFRKYLLSFLSLAIVGGCSLWLTEDNFQCSEDADCSEFANTTCDLSRHICVLDVSVPGADAGGDSGGCGQCTTDESCVDNQCKSVESAECTQLVGGESPNKSNARLLGMILPRGTQTAEDYLSAEILRALTPVSEYYAANRVAAGLDPVSVVVCDELADPATVLDHLAALNVKVVIGPNTASALFALLPLVKPRQITLISPLVDDVRLEDTGGAALQAVADGNLISLKPNRRREYESYGPALQKAHELAAAKNPGSFFATLKPVVLWNKNNPDSVAFRDELLKRFPSWPPIEYEGVGLESDVAAKVKAEAPNFVATASPDDAWATVFEALDAVYSAETDKPYYFVPGESDLISYKIARDELSERSFALPLQRPSASEAVYDVYAELYKKSYPGDPPELTDYVVDAFYLAIYASHRAKDSPTPSDVRTAILDLAGTPGSAISLLDAQAVAGAMSASSDDADLSGTSGRLDIDSVLGSPREMLKLRCFPPKVKAVDFCDTGFLFDPTTGAVSGAPNAACACP